MIGFGGHGHGLGSGLGQWGAWTPQWTQWTWTLPCSCHRARPDGPWPQLVQKIRRMSRASLGVGSGSKKSDHAKGSGNERANEY